LNILFHIITPFAYAPNARFASHLERRKCGLRLPLLA
jgi:hypothetical protein